jgi:drug/metabolite transporter (DMT)-like permease
LWTAGIGHVFFPETCRWSYREVLLAVWCLGGVAVLLSGRQQETYYWGVLCALVSALCQAGVNLTIRGMQGEPPARVAFWGMAGSVVMGLPGCIVHRPPGLFPTGHTEVLSLVATGLLSAAAQWCKTHSLQTSHSLSVLILRHLEIVFSVLWDVLLFHKGLSWRTPTGVGIVLSGCVGKVVLDAMTATPRCRGGSPSTPPDGEAV